MLTRTVVGRTFTYSHCVGLFVMSGGGFWHPWDLALASAGSMYVVSRGDPNELLATRVTKCTVDQEFILQFGRRGNGDGEFTAVTSIALDSDENAYVADEALNRINIFDKEGHYLAKWGKEGSADGEFVRPSGLAFDSENNLWVVDSGNSRVQKFTGDGKFLAKWGGAGSGEGQLNMPWGITFDSQGYVYVADWRNGRVQKLTPDGEYLMSFGAPGSGVGELRRPTGVAVDSEGDVYVTDWRSHVVQVYEPDGSHITTFKGDAHDLTKWANNQFAVSVDYHNAWKRAGNLEASRLFHFPVAVAVDADGHIVIADQQRHRLQIYVKEKDYVEPQFNL